MSTTPNEPHDSQFGDQARPQPNPAQPHSPQPEAGQNPQGGHNAQQYGQQGGKYGTTEYNPNDYTGLVQRPAQLDKLLKLTLLSAVLYVLNAVVGAIATATTDLTQYYRDLGMSTEDAEAFAGEGSGIVTTIVLLAVALLLYFLVYRGLNKGKNWARILGTVLAALAILSNLFGLFGVFIYGALGIVLLVIMLIKLIVDILWIVTAFRAPNSAYFAQNSRR